MKTHLDLLQGTWTISALEVDGQKMSSEMLNAATIVVKGSRFTSKGMGPVYKGTLELDSSTTPAHLDMNFDAGPEKGNRNLAIYKLDGDTWTMCIATRGNVRPTRFQTKANSGFALETLVRGVPAAKPKASKSSVSAGPATELEGEWQMVSGVMDGAPMDKSLVKWVKRVTTGNLTKVIAGPQLMMQFEFTHDASKSPNSIDYVNTAGANKGKTQLGIYALKGTELTVCVAAPGVARPTDMKPGDKRTLTVWKRGT